MRNRFSTFHAKSSWPVDGTQPPYSVYMAQKSGGLAVTGERVSGEGYISNANAIAARISTSDLLGSGTIDADLSQIVQAASAMTGSGTISADLTAVAIMQSALAGSGSITNAQASATIPITAGLNGSCSLSPELKGYGRLNADITPFTELSPENLASQLLDSNEVETDYTVREALRLILSTLAGKVSGAPGTTITIRSVTDGTDRVVATVDANGNRTAVTYDVSDE